MQTYWSNPGAYAEQLSVLPEQPVLLADMLENFLIHHATARHLGFGVPEQTESDRNLRTVERMLSTIFQRDARSLSEHRDLPDYFYGSCHDFALLAVSAFRQRGIEARLRGGFVSYHRRGFWMDHWLCEYRQGGEWRLLDAQMGARAREGFGTDFDVGDVPRVLFLCGAQMWQQIRSGAIDPACCGVPFAGIEGEWFVASSVMRDLAAMAHIEVLPWDYWGPGRDFVVREALTPDQVVQIDQLAAVSLEGFDSPEQAAKVYESFEWARPTPQVLSPIMGELTERSLY